MKKSWIHILLLVGAIVMVIPFFWMVSTSFKSYLESMQIPPTVFPEQFRFDNYARVFESADFLTYYANTIFVTVVRTASQLFLCSMAAYAFARLDFPFKNTLFLVILSVLMVPIQVILIPNYALLSQFGWINTFYALIVPGIFSAFGVFLLRQFFMGIPKELDEAAIMDGCSKWGVYWRVILPNAKPALVALGIFTVLASWNDFMWPLVMTNSADMRVLSVGIANFEGQYSTEYPLLMAAALMSTIPMLLMFLFLQKYLIAGIALGGVRR
ncbi:MULTISPECIES: carbohydrate ABC transporter permease [Shouchella]|uniref:Carbohydrate ABC transporter permease n=2 Tax=Shouchella TaxID=2893057 RepID=A0ABY7W7Q6_9BACI|nr:MULTISPECIES: carbohydrate ABC transporter permease [Shouchella]MED4128175.1 carbohydrate ABC transporter permease [Shouchella miscanthi]WDF04973.1 carbohydrate ABC transporter permease [Shouchella hunanensis]GAF21132.1 N-acetyl-D-glucosamine ABC transport system, permease protein 2 [Bacillus sp. JCM 19047]